AAGTLAAGADIRPRSCCAAGRLPWPAYQAMNRLMPKNTTASHLVDLDRKLDAPRAPNTVPEAPAPKPEPAAAPEPRCIRISAIMATATTTYTTLRINISIWNPSSDYVQSGCSRRPGDGQKIGGHQRGTAHQPSIDIALGEQIAGIDGIHAATVNNGQGIRDSSIDLGYFATDEGMDLLCLFLAGGTA